MSLSAEHYLRIWLGRREAVTRMNISAAQTAEIDNLVTALRAQSRNTQIETQSNANGVQFTQATTGEVIATISFGDANA